MSALQSPVVDLGGPYFDDLEVGDVLDAAPAMTLTEGHAAVHQAVVGDRLRLALDVALARDVIGGDARPAHPALVWDVAVGQSTLLTRRVIANVFFRNLKFRRAPAIGDTLRTSTEVVAMRETTRRPDRAATGLAVLRLRTTDQHGREVLDFWRCALLPLRDGSPPTGHADLLEAIPEDEPGGPGAGHFVARWDLERFAESVPGAHFADLRPGMSWRVTGGDVVGCAPELARLSLNVATVHHDGGARAGGERLVYGGHTIGLAMAHATQALPNLVTVAAWHSCDHIGPVLEGDTLQSALELERTQPLAGGGGLVHLRSRVAAVTRGGAPRPVLDWRFAGVMA